MPHNLVEVGVLRILWVYSSMGVGYGKNGKKLYELKNYWSCRWISQCDIRDKELNFFSCSQFHFETIFM